MSYYPLFVLALCVDSGSLAAQLPTGPSELQRTGLTCFACNTMNYLNESSNKCRFLQARQAKEKDSPEVAHHETMNTMQPQQAQSPKTGTDQTMSPALGAAEGVGHLMRRHGFDNFVIFNRSLSANDHIETRQCASNEHYCTVRSVVRYEFLGDEIQSKFWMLERNCSKTCYNDCMLIGDRNRLRVCNSCCKSNDCNLGSGTGFVRPLQAGLLVAASLLAASLASLPVCSPKTLHTMGLDGH